MSSIRHVPNSWEIGTNPLVALEDNEVLEALSDWRGCSSPFWTAGHTTLALCFLNELEKRFVHVL